MCAVVNLAVQNALRLLEPVRQFQISCMTPHTRALCFAAVSGWLLVPPGLRGTRWPEYLVQAAQREGRVAEIPSRLPNDAQGQLGVTCKVNWQPSLSA